VVLLLLVVVVVGKQLQYGAGWALRVTMALHLAGVIE